MSVFNFMETFFFISLGITFVLILLLVYHFKQRLSMVEQKGDTMFDIINNMVKEMGVIKSLVMSHVIPQQVPFYTAPSSMNVDANTFSQMNSNPMVEDISMTYETPVAQDSEDDSEAESSSEELDDSDAESSEEGEESDDESDDDVVDDSALSKSIIDTADSGNKILVSDDEIGVEVETIETYVEELSVNGIVSENLVVENIVESLVETTVIQSEELAKFETIEPIEPIEPIEETTETIVSEPVLVDSTKEDYRKLNLQELKELVVRKGLATDASKLKKSKLLELLTTST